MDVLMPQLGETVAEGTVATWHKQEGDTVEVDEILCDIETDKVSMEIPAPKAGKIAKILVGDGETVPVGTVLAVVLGEGESLDDAAASAKPAAPAATAASADSAPEPAPAAPQSSAPAASAPPAAPAASTASGTASGQAVARSEGQKLSPAVRRLVAEHNLDVASIPGTGRNGRVTRRNVLEFIESGGAAAPVAAPPAAAARGPASGALESRRIPFNRVRRLTADHMVKSKATSPHVLQAVEVDFSGVDRVRRAVRESWKARNGYSLTFLPFIAHAVCTAIREFPHVNASIGDNELILHGEVNLAIAIDLGADGLVAPVIRGAERMNVAQLAAAINDLATRARSNRLRPDDLAGGTYTLSNSGTFGTLITAPIINQPQVAILSTDGVRKKPVVIEHPDGDSIAIRPIGILAQSFDHRAFDGAYSAAFLDRLRKLLEQTDWYREI